VSELSARSVATSAGRRCIIPIIAELELTSVLIVSSATQSCMTRFPIAPKYHCTCGVRRLLSEYAIKDGCLRIHSNTIEQIWGDIKGILRTVHHGVSKKYRQLYLNQYIWKYQQYAKTSNFFYTVLCQLLRPMFGGIITPQNRHIAEEI